MTIGCYNSEDTSLFVNGILGEGASALWEIEQVSQIPKRYPLYILLGSCFAQKVSKYVTFMSGSYYLKQQQKHEDNNRSNNG